jgi:sec-independent protein translocase protein TatC
MDSPFNIRSLPIFKRFAELRKRLFIVAAAWVALLLTAWGLSEYIMAFVERPLLGHAKLQFDTLTAPFITHFKASAYTAVFLVLPLALLEVWLFARQILGKREQRMIFPYLVLSYLLFVGGAVFCYLVPFPLAVDFFINFDPEIHPSLRVDDYLTFVLRLLIIFGLMFEMPLVSLLLTRFGILTPELLAKHRGYAVVLLFMLAAVLTPPDVLSMIMLAVPLIGLYEVSILVSRLARRRHPEAS